MLIHRKFWFHFFGQNEIYYCFLFSAIFLKSLNRITWNVVVMTDIMCRCAYPQEILTPFFFLWITLFLNFEIWRKWKILLVQLVSTTPLKPLNRISRNFVDLKDIMCRCAFLQEMLIWSVWGAIYIPFFVRLPVIMLGIAIHCIQHSQAMLERRVCELAHSFFHHTLRLLTCDFRIVQCLAWNVSRFIRLLKWQNTFFWVL